MRSNILTRRKSSTPSQLFDLHEDLNELISANKVSEWKAENYGWTSQYQYDKYRWRYGLQESDLSRSRRESSVSNTVTSSLINPSVDETIDAIATMTVHEILTSIESVSEITNPRGSTSSLTMLSSRMFESLWSILEETGLRDFEDSILYVRRLPQRWEITDFLNHLHAATQFSPECFVISMVYVSRILNNPYRITLSSLTWRPLFFSCILIAHKYWDDDYLANQDFVLGYPQHSGLEANSLERTTLKLLEYRVGVLPSAYARSYFGLRAAMTLTREKESRRQIEVSRIATPRSSLSSVPSPRTDYGTSGYHSSLSDSSFSTEISHKELRRDLLHIIHGSDCTCQMELSEPLQQQQRIMDRTLSSPRDPLKSSWAYPMRQAGQILKDMKRALTRTNTSRRNFNDVSQALFCRDPTFNNSIITMVIQPYRHKSNSVNVERWTHKKASSPYSNNATRKQNMVTPLGTPASLSFGRRRSLSFESLPTLKKGLQVNNVDTQPPIIGAADPPFEPTISDVCQQNLAQRNDDEVQNETDNSDKSEDEVAYLLPCEQSNVVSKKGNEVFIKHWDRIKQPSSASYDYNHYPHWDNRSFEGGLE